MRRQVSSMPRDILKLNMELQLTEIASERLGKDVEACTDAELYYVLMEYCRRLLLVTERNDGVRRVYYVSAEYLPGRLLLTNLINLKTFEMVREYLRQRGRNLSAILDWEVEPGLGSGGLGRFSSCLLDACATLGYPVEGIGLCYHYGLFRQEIREGEQVPGTRPWMQEDGWTRRRSNAYEVRFGDGTVQSTMVDLDVVGYDNGRIPLHLFDVAGTDTGVPMRDGRFDRRDFRRSLSLFVYPDDSDEEGKLLRIHQQYFLASNAVQLILQHMRENKVDLRDMAKYCVVQINDTHATLMVPEFMRILVFQKAFDVETAISVVEQICAYTNHTTLAESLEVWHLSLLEQVVPQLIPVILYLDRRVKLHCQDPELSIIDSDNMVHMVRICTHYCFSVNGVSNAHAKVLRESTLARFWEYYPGKFSAITNGISFRRWLLCCNHPLTDFLTERIGAGFRRESGRLEELLAYAEDDKVLHSLDRIKYQNKVRLARRVYEKEGIRLDPDGVFDICARRFHEYKRQHLLALAIIHTYLEAKRGNKPPVPVNFIVGGKAALDYDFAKDMIHLMVTLQDLINGDPAVQDCLRMCFIEDYDVTWAEYLVPAGDISEQISLAGKEASGTSNMKYMLNGALTLGTRDGTNVDIGERTGEEAFYSFGMSAEEARALEGSGYIPAEVLERDPAAMEALAFLIDPVLLARGREDRLRRLHDVILTEDRYFALEDFASYRAARERLLADYRDRRGWNRKVLINIAKAGYFSADRTAAEYGATIWGLD